MGNIKQEKEFWLYMERFGPNAEKSKNNYISWLRFVADNFSSIDESLSNESIKRICFQMSKTSGSRSIYRTDNDISNIKSALNKYLKFISSN